MAISEMNSHINSSPSKRHIKPGCIDNMRSITVTLLVLGLVSLALAQYDYADVIRRSLLFYEAQRTGVLPANNRIPWRGNSFVTDRGANGENLSGGYFDGMNGII